MSTAVDIRPAVDSDREAIRQMAQEVVDAGDAFVFDAVPDVMDYWYQPDSHVFAAAKGGDVLGTYVVKANQRGQRLTCRQHRLYGEQGGARVGPWPIDG